MCLLNIQNHQPQVDAAHLRIDSDHLIKHAACEPALGWEKPFSRPSLEPITTKNASGIGVVTINPTDESGGDSEETPPFHLNLPYRLSTIRRLETNTTRDEHT